MEQQGGSLVFCESLPSCSTARQVRKWQATRTQVPSVLK